MAAKKSKGRSGAKVETDGELDAILSNLNTGVASLDRFIHEKKKACVLADLAMQSKSRAEMHKALRLLRELDARISIDLQNIEETMKEMQKKKEKGTAS